MLLKIKAILTGKRFALYTRPYELNIVGLRSASTASNRFDDHLHVFYRTSGPGWQYHIFRITTDPGTYWLKNPLQPQGTAILAEGQYLHAYQIGLHRGKYKALVQAKPITVLRDYDRNAVLDFYNGKKHTGMFGVNIHHAASSGTTKTIDKYSAGCQVFENAADFNVFMLLCEKHRAKYGNQFTYTLIDFRAVQRQTRKWLLTGTVLVGAAATGTYLYMNAT